MPPTSGSKASSSDSSPSDAGATSNGTEKGEEGDAKPSADAPDGDAPVEKKKRKLVRRRVEPLPQFASAAQESLGQLQTKFDEAQALYKGECMLATSPIHTSSIENKAVQFY